MRNGYYYPLLAVLLAAILALAACGGDQSVTTDGVTVGEGGDTPAVDAGVTDFAGDAEPEVLITQVVGTPPGLAVQSDLAATTDALQDQGTGGVPEQTAASPTPEIAATPAVVVEPSASPVLGATPEEAAAATPVAGTTAESDTTAMPMTGQGTLFINDRYGFAVELPAGWALREVEAHGAGVPQDWPVLATWLVMPREVALQIQDQTAAMGGLTQGGTETTGATPAAQPGGLTQTGEVVAPFMIEVVQGDETALGRVYPTYDPAAGQTTAFGDNEVTVFTVDPGYTQAFYQHPDREDLWIVVTDWVSQFPGREEQAATVSDQWQPFLESFDFSTAQFDMTGGPADQ